MQSPELRNRAIFRYLGVIIVAALVALTVTLLMPAARYNNESNSSASPIPAQALSDPSVFPTWPQVSVEHQSNKLPTSFAAPVRPFVEAPVSAPSDPWNATHPGLGPVRDQPPTADSEPTASPMNLSPATEGRSKLDPNTATAPVDDGAQKEPLALVASGNREAPQDKPDRPMSQEQIRTLLNQGQDFVSVGDISTARILFARVAEARDARGALAMAATYDPVALGRFGVKGVKPDINKAREWYRKAMELGSPSAASAVEAMTKNVQ